MKLSSTSLLRISRVHNIPDNHCIQEACCFSSSPVRAGATLHYPRRLAIPLHRDAVTMPPRTPPHFSISTDVMRGMTKQDGTDEVCMAADEFRVGQTASARVTGSGTDAGRLSLNEAGSPGDSVTGDDAPA